MKMKRSFTALWLVLGTSLGGGAAILLVRLLVRLAIIPEDMLLNWTTGGMLGGVAVGGLIGQFTADRMYRALEEGVRWLQTRPLMDLITGGGGLVAGLLIAALLSRLTALFEQHWLALVVSAILYLVLGYVGTMLGLNHREGWKALLPERMRRRLQAEMDAAGEEFDIPPKIVDSSALIDGRLAALVGAGVPEGELIVPRFVMDELQLLADSEDEGRRRRGRRGLEQLEALMEEFPERCTLHEGNNDHIRTVDGKLVWLARQLSGRIVTLDYNLCRVAAVQSVPALNLHALERALQMPLAAGDTLSVTVEREGREPGQGVAHLPGGVMVIVDGGAALVGREVTVSVTRVIANATGKTVFVRIQN